MSGSVTVRVSLSWTGTANKLPAVSRISDPCGILRAIVPAVVGVTWTVNTPGDVSAIAPMVTAEVPALSKSALVTLVSSISSLNTNVYVSVVFVTTALSASPSSMETTVGGTLSGNVVKFHRSLLAIPVKKLFDASAKAVAGIST